MENDRQLVIIKNNQKDCGEEFSCKYFTKRELDTILWLKDCIGVDMSVIIPEDENFETIPGTRNKEAEKVIVANSYYSDMPICLNLTNDQVALIRWLVKREGLLATTTQWFFPNE